MLNHIRNTIQSYVHDHSRAFSIMASLPVWAVAYAWRTLLVRTTFVAITGSFGKTTAKECLAAMLATAGPTARTPGNWNGRMGIAGSLLRVRPWHRFAVIETGTDEPGGLVKASMLLRPHVVLVLCVAGAHTQGFGDLEATAKEKSRLLRFLRKDGTAVLNGDDDRVAAMAVDARERRVIAFGLEEGRDVRADDVSSIWPARLEMTVSTKTQQERVTTLLVGTHWTNSVLGAIAAATACGVTLQKAAEGLADVPPYSGRMCPETLPNGAVVLRDDFNGCIDGFHRAIDVLRDARAERKILVMTDCSDFRKNPRKRMNFYARVAHETADMVIFIGERCEYGVARAIREGMTPDQAHGRFKLEEAAELLQQVARPGDLILLRGRGTDHVARVYFRMLGSVRCKRVKCPLMMLCDRCPKLGFKPETSDTTSPVAVSSQTRV